MEVALRDFFHNPLPPHPFDSHLPNSEILVIDTHKEVGEFLVRSREEGIFTVTLDNFDPRGADLNFFVFEHPGLPLPPKRLSGWKYLMINEKVRNLGTKDGGYVLVTIGGEDVLGKGSEVAEALLLGGQKVILVNGPKASQQVRLSDPNLIFYHNPPHFLELLANAKGIVVNGGNTLFEGLHLKKKAYVLPQTPLENNIADIFLRKNYILGVIHDIKTAKFDFDAMVSPAEELDGRGAERIALAIRDALWKKENA